jgi:hypothetical protein
MIAEISTALKKHGPLRIDEVDYVEPTVTLMGRDWSLAVTCPWRLVRGSTTLVAWNDTTVADQIWELVGTAVIDVRTWSTHHPNDPAFVLTSSDRVELEADSDLDPWVLRLPDRTFVGSIG